MKAQLFILLALVCGLVYAATTSKPIVVKPKEKLAANDNSDITPTPTLPPEINGVTLPYDPCQDMPKVVCELLLRQVCFFKDNKCKLRWLNRIG